MSRYFISFTFRCHRTCPQQWQYYRCKVMVVHIMCAHLCLQCHIMFEANIGCLHIQICCHIFLSFLSAYELRKSVYEAAIFLRRVRTLKPLAVVRFHRLLWDCSSDGSDAGEAVAPCVRPPECELTHRGCLHQLLMANINSWNSSEQAFLTASCVD